MINEAMFLLKKNGEPRKCRCYCRKPELIENYDKAIADKTQMWEVHHRKEEFYSYKELIERGEYFDVPPEELIFLTPTEHNNIDSACKRRGKAMKGKHWNLSDETKRKISEANKGKKGHKKPEGAGKPPKKVLCVETGEVFDSVNEASRKVRDTNISAACNGSRKTAGGYHWSFVE